MEELRRDLGRNVEQTVENAREMLDWRHYVSTHPWLCLTAAAVAGFLLVPRRIGHAPLGREAIDELAARGLLVVRPQPPRSGGQIATLMGGAAARLAGRMITSRIANYVENRLRERGN
jgi:hypothetical protein